MSIKANDGTVGSVTLKGMEPNEYHRFYTVASDGLGLMVNINGESVYISEDEIDSASFDDEADNV